MSLCDRAACARLEERVRKVCAMMAKDSSDYMADVDDDKSELLEHYRKILLDALAQAKS